MKPIDYLKAVGVAAGVLAANMLLLVLVVFIYSQAFARGRSPEFYNQLAMEMGWWTAPIGGAILMFLAGYVLGRRRPDRNAIAFAGALVAAYVVIDVLMGLAMTVAGELFTPRYLLSLAVTALGALAGGWLARRGRAA